MRIDNHFGGALVRARRFEWMDGMRMLTYSNEAFRVISATPESDPLVVDETSGRLFRIDEMWLFDHIPEPDMTDPATLGCVLDLVRLIHDDLSICLVSHEEIDGIAWSMGGWWGSKFCTLVTPHRSELLVAMVEAAS